MRGFAITIDRRASRSQPADVVVSDLRWLNDRFAAGLIRPFAVTAGDEIQSLTIDPELVVQLAIDAAENGAWWVGIGFGTVEEPIPDTVNAARGEAFYRARDAVRDSKTTDAGLAVRGDEPFEDALVALTYIVARRTPAQYETVDLARRGLRQAEIADELDITQQAVSKRLDAAAWPIERRLRDLSEWLAARLVQP